jgi:hypothetical protein
MGGEASSCRRRDGLAIFFLKVSKDRKVTLSPEACRAVGLTAGSTLTLIVNDGQIRVLTERAIEDLAQDAKGDDK